MGGTDPQHPSAYGLELERARSVQMSMLPQVPSIDSLDIAASYRACDMLGGDFYDFILIDAWRIGVLIADVSGHGTAAALLMAAAKKVLQLCGRGNHSPRQVLLDVNDSIRGDVPNGMFLSVLYAVIDIRTHSVCFSSCGHNPPIVRRGKQVKDDWAHDNAPVVGIMPSSRLGKYLKEEVIQMQPDDLLVFYTDGLTEAFNSDEQMYGEERLMQIVLDAPDSSPRAIVESIRRNVDAFRASAKLSDDETLVVMRFDKPRDNVSPLVAGGSLPEAALPTFTSPMFGRDEDIAELAARLRAKSHPLLSLIGMPGVGKSRLAVAAVETALATFPGGVHYVDLQHSESVGDVCRQVATALRLGDDETRLGLRISMALQSSSGRSLLLLDNCERARASVQRCVEEWASRAGNLQVLATGRASLEASGETCIQVKPLSTPRAGKDVLKTPADAEKFEAVQLFIERARESDRKFKLTQQNFTDIAHICARLDGLPQAIQLAAGRIAMLSAQQILERLDKSFELARDGKQVEQDTLQGTLAMSWDLLPPQEQQALMLLSQFPDGFQLDAGARVLESIDGYAPEDLVVSLLKQSLLHSEVMEDLENERRFTMFESVRGFARLKLKASGAERKAWSAFERAVLEYVKHWWQVESEQGLSLAARRVRHESEAMLDIIANGESAEARAWCAVIIAPLLHGNGDANRAHEVLQATQEDLPADSDVAAWIHVTDAGLRLDEAPEEVAEALEDVSGGEDVRFAALLTRATALQSLGRREEAIGELRAAGEMKGLSPIRQAKLMDRLGLIYGASGRTNDARRLFTAALKLAREQKANHQIAHITFNLGWVNMRSDRPEEAVGQLKAALELAQTEGDKAFEANTVGVLALALHLAGERQGAEACMLRGIRLSRELGKTFTEVTQLNTLTRIYHEQSRAEEALRIATSAKSLAHEIGARKSEAVAEGNIAALSFLLGKDPQEAEESWRNSYRLLMELGEVRSALSSLSNLGVMLGEHWKARGNERELHAAIEALSEAASQRRELGYEPLVDAELLLAELLVETGNLAEARIQLEQTLATARAGDDDVSRKTVADGERLLAELETNSLVKPAARPGPGGRTRPRPSLPSGPLGGRRGGKPVRGGGLLPKVKGQRRAASSGKLPTVDAPRRTASSDNLRTVKAPRPATSSENLRTIKAPPTKKDSSPKLPKVPNPKKRKTDSGSMPSVNTKRPKGTPGVAPRRRPRGFQ